MNRLSFFFDDEHKYFISRSYPLENYYHKLHKDFKYLYEYALLFDDKLRAFNTKDRRIVNALDPIDSQDLCTNGYTDKHINTNSEYTTKLLRSDLKAKIDSELKSLRSEIVLFINDINFLTNKINNLKDDIGILKYDSYNTELKYPFRYTDSPLKLQFLLLNNGTSIMILTGKLKFTPIPIENFIPVIGPTAVLAEGIVKAFVDNVGEYVVSKINITGGLGPH